ncbi:hypothetical protein AB0K40_10105 [Nonomuraea bangladeshensis]|uniref:Uncharacterized protein n=1 Tax=Nonomuraea bangladeshensis TaxID=404385 RepID=A0ABV3H0A6_9ACTN
MVPLYETDPGRYGRTFVTAEVSACVYYLPLPGPMSFVADIRQ